MSPTDEVSKYILELKAERPALPDCRVSLQGGTLADVQVVAGRSVRVFDLGGGLTDRVRLAIRSWLEGAESDSRSVGATARGF